MPVYGTLDVERALATAPTAASLSPEPWTLPGASVLQVSFEVAEDPALELVPPALHPSIPPYATFSFLACPESPVGPFTLAMVRLIVRAGIRPRGLLLAARTDSEAAVPALTSGWGYRIEVADVALSHRHNRIRGEVRIDGEDALAVALEDPEPIAGKDLELFDNLHLTKVAEGDPVIVQVDPGYDYQSADRGRATLDRFSATSFGIEGLVPTHPLVAVACRADISLGAPRFVMDPSEPAVKSTKRL